ncbi:rhodanese-like domain-containing protein [Salmonella enterica]|nr:rhodanese-like domain-containing protein [Salmonella enterica]EKC2597421.1 rhodanese-like domain-containing protein [Salmonella enterica]EMD3507974.1 rhodanese-like domain-containing protein [Salmonella enterica]EMD4682138.1 rhodanese-like domain-containing protein [Salmonella enterica]EMD4827695.1 rhodanese-like domain-containing protein [Salmonella enterica]
MVIYCKSGARSQRAVMYLQEEGFSSVMSLTGGIMNITAENIKSLLKSYERSIR